MIELTNMWLRNRSSELEPEVTLERWNLNEQVNWVIALQSENNDKPIKGREQFTKTLDHE